ncbi:MAG: hypothetical protein ACE5EQ_01005 [Phycisphaerae bacterium]
MASILRRHRILIAALLLLGHIPVSAIAGERLKIGKPYPPLVLWSIEGDEPISIDAYREKKVLILNFASWSPDVRLSIDTWRAETRSLVKGGKLVLLGVMQEQHRDRCRLFAQWQKLDFPILHDALNLAGVTKLPTVVAVDEHGIIRAIDPAPETLQKEFVNKKFPKAKRRNRRAPVLELPNPKFTRRIAGESRQIKEQREHGDALVLGGIPQQIDEALNAYEQALRIAPEDAASFFRLGVTRRIRYDSPQRQPGDFQAAINAWIRAAQIDRKNQVYQGRVHQYGVCLEKPSTMYAWIGKARREIADRGEKPIRLEVEPIAAERAKPRKKFKSAKSDPPETASATNVQDGQGLIDVETVVVRGIRRKDRRFARILLVFRPTVDHWDNREGVLRVRIDPPNGIRVSKRVIKLARSDLSGLDTSRTVDFEVKMPKKQTKPIRIPCVAHCRIAGTKTRRVRRTFEVTITPEEKPKPNPRADRN